MKKLSVCVLFGSMSAEHEVLLRSAESVLNNLDPEKYNIFPVGITKTGDWVLFTGTDYSMLPTGQWLDYPGNRRAAISPVRGQGLLSFEGDCVVRERIDVVFPVLYGENGEDGTIQGLLRLAGIPYVGAHVAASVVAMDKALTKLVADQEGVPQAAWMLVRGRDLDSRIDQTMDGVERRFSYPVFVKPSNAASSAGVTKAANREELRAGLLAAGAYDDRILVEEFIDGVEVEVAVMGNDSPVASVCGEIDHSVEIYDYDEKYVTDTSVAYIPTRIPEEIEEQVRDTAVRIYSAIGCKGLSRVDFFVTRKDDKVFFHGIHTLPGFTSVSMYPKLFAASGIPYGQLIDELLQLALEACQ